MDSLEKLTREELLKVARHLHLRGFSKLDKKKLVRHARKAIHQRYLGGDVQPDAAPKATTPMASTTTTTKAAAPAPAPAPAPKPLTPEQEIQAANDLYQEQIKNNPYGRFDAPQVPTSVMQDNGLPWFLSQHPNAFSNNQNQVIVYKSALEFLTGAFYKKYQKRLITVLPIKGFNGQETVKEVPKKPLRFVFMSSSPQDKTQMYLDSKNQDDYLDIWDGIKDANGALMPTELIAMKNIMVNRQKAAQLAETNKDSARFGYGYGQYDMSVQKNKELDALDKFRLAEEVAKDKEMESRDKIYQANRQASYYMGKDDGRTAEGEHDEKEKENSGGGGGSDGLFGFLGDAVGSIFGAGLKKKHKKKKASTRRGGAMSDAEEKRMFNPSDGGKNTLEVLFRKR
jgi:hypothetical protein